MNAFLQVALTCLLPLLPLRILLLLLQLLIIEEHVELDGLCKVCH